MASSSPAERLTRAWRRLAPLPGGRAVFGLLLRRIVPYSATVHPRIEVLRPGYARITITDRRSVRNHLRSIHAIALANVAELTCGLAMTMALDAGVRGIVLGMSIDFRKKARGTITAEATVEAPAVAEERDVDIAASLYDASGDLVAHATVRWRLAPAAPAASAATARPRVAARTPAT